MNLWPLVQVACYIGVPVATLVLAIFGVAACVDAYGGVR